MRPLGERISALENEVDNIRGMLEEQNKGAEKRDERLQKIERLLWALLGGLAVVEFALKLIPSLLEVYFKK